MRYKGYRVETLSSAKELLNETIKDMYSEQAVGVTVQRSVERYGLRLWTQELPTRRKAMRSHGNHAECKKKIIEKDQHLKGGKGKGIQERKSEVNKNKGRSIKYESPLNIVKLYREVSKDKELHLGGGDIAHRQSLVAMARRFFMK